MRFGKVLCGVTAALTVLSSTAIASQAEEAAELKLLTAPLSDLGLNGANFIRDGYYVGNGKFYRIGNEELAKWRESGKIAYSTLSSDLDITDLSWWTGDFDSGYSQFVKKDSDGNITERYVVSVDKAIGKVSTAYTLPADWAYTNSDGYTISDEQNGKNISIIVYDPTGKKSSVTTTLLSEDDQWGLSASHGGVNAGYFLMTSENEQGSKQSVYAIKKNGDLELIDKGEGVSGSIYGTEENCSLFFYNNVIGRFSYLKLYSSDNNKVYDVCSGVGLKSGSDDLRFNELASKLYGTKVVLGQVIQSESKYALVNLRDGEDAELISKTYKFMSTNDGKIYLVQTEEDKWGYIDSNGKELAIFDDASEFKGDYAAVLKNGKAYLIDRNMKKVSDETDADSIAEIHEKDLFAFVRDGKAYLMTYAKNSESKPDDTSSTTSEPVSEPASNPTSEPTSEPTSSEPSSEPISESSASKPDGSDNPTTGAPALIPVALIGGAALIVSRKRR